MINCYFPLPLLERIGSIPGGALGVSGTKPPASKDNAPSKDAAYDEFMREIEGLL